MARGTEDARAGPAMTLAEAAEAQRAGAEAVDDAVDTDGSTCVCVGELGLGNSTAAAALLAALAGVPPEDAAGAGTGLDADGRALKARAVAAMLAANGAVGAAEGPAGWLRGVGGLELAAMAGAVLRAAERGVPVVVDGFIAGAAALVALRMRPAAAAAVFLSHRSAERGAAALVDALAGAGAGRPPLRFGMRLGEGTGAVLAVPLLRSAGALFRMATLESVLQDGV